MGTGLESGQEVYARADRVPECELIEKRGLCVGADTLPISVDHSPFSRIDPRTREGSISLVSFLVLFCRVMGLAGGKQQAHLITSVYALSHGCEMCGTCGLKRQLGNEQLGEME